MAENDQTSLLGLVKIFFKDQAPIVLFNFGALVLGALIFAYLGYKFFDKLNSLNFWGNDFVIFVLLIAGIYYLSVHGHRECRNYCNQSKAFNQN